MKLLFINGHLNTGGVERSLVDILNHINTEKNEVDLLLLEELGDYAPLLPPQINVQLHSIENTYGPLLETLLRCIQQRDWFSLKMRLIFLVMKVLGQEKISLAKKLLTNGKHYDCVIGYRRGLCTQVAAYAVNADRRITWWHHGIFNADAISYEREVRNCDRIVAVSDACRKFLEENVPSIRSKLVTIPNMLDIKKVQYKADAFQPYHRKDVFQIVSVGGLVPEKHFFNAIYAAKILKSKKINFQWHLVGEGCLQQELQKQIIEAEVGDCFIMEGNQPNPYPYLKNADLFVHPSYVESQGIVVMEAMALGVPCIVTESLGPCEFIENGVNGILTEKNPESLTEKVLEILSNQELYHKIKKSTVCPKQFLPEHVMDQVEEVLDAVRGKDE